MHKAGLGVVAASLLGGCASGLPGLRPLTYQEPGETRVYASYQACPHKAGDNFAPILAAVAVEAASQLIKGFGTALSKGAEGGALPASVSSTNIEVGRDLPQCLVIIRGKFSPDSGRKVEVALPPIPGDVQPLKLIRADGSAVTAALPVVYDLQHYIEVALTPSRNKSAMTFGAALVYVARSMDGAKTGDRSLSIAVKFSRPGHDDVGSALLIGSRTIGNMNAYPAGPASRMLYEAPWFPIVEGSEPEKTAATGTGVTQGGTTVPTTPRGTTSAPSIHSSPAGTTAATTASLGAITAAAQSASDSLPGTVNGPFPYTVTATVIETRPTKEFLAFVASVFTAVEPTLTDKVKGAIDPDARQAAQGTAIDNQSSYATALANAQTALFAYCALKSDAAKADLIAKSAAARTMQLAANKAALTGDMTAPFPSLIDVGVADPQGVPTCAVYR